MSGRRYIVIGWGWEWEWSCEDMSEDFGVEDDGAEGLDRWRFIEIVNFKNLIFVTENSGLSH
jgi:hypothetical protein